MPDVIDLAAAEEPVRKIVSAPLATVEQHDTLRDVARVLTGDEIGAVLVSSPMGPVGLVSERDVVSRAATGGDLDNEQVRTLMSVDLVSANVDDPIAAVGRTMVESGMRHVIVRDGGRIVGIVSMRDVLAALLA